ncbi:tetratricopeptide repeat protein [Salmonella enterica subsp. enterica serovar Java]|nr:tetratricopeptide repeat protein [Salmonella enterica subsp. enterica serovar Java]
MVKLIVQLGLLFFLTACNTNKGLDNNEREYILTKVNNYQGLIQFYREQLSKEDTSEVRFKLCEVYNKVSDIPSSQSCLRELLNNSPTDKSYLLAAKNYLLLDDIEGALLMVNNALNKEPNNGEAFNVRGEILARRGDYDGARKDFEKARDLFVAEELVNNNLAMLAILQHDYTLAYSYLMPLYSRGYNSSEIVHNLIFVLIKNGDYATADSLMQQNSLNDLNGALIAKLAGVDPSLNIQYKSKLKTKDDNKVEVGELNKQSSSNDKTKRATIFTPATKLTQPDSSTNEISNIIIGDHGKFVRFVFITPHPLKGIAKRCDKDNQALLTIVNSRSNKKIEGVIDGINKFTKSINSISVRETDGALLLAFDTKREIKKVRVYNSALSTVSTNKLVFDIIYK